MGLHEVTKEAVMAAIAEYDQVGRDDFLARYRYGTARSYFVQHDDRLYDSKAIVGVAHGYVDGRAPLVSSEFSGGEQTVGRLLRGLGFTVVPVRAPAWLRDEVILACELVRQNDWRWLSVSDPRVIELSALLQRMPLHPMEVRGPKFRNPNGVARKTADIATQHPDYNGRSTNGGAVDREVLKDFLDRPDEMSATAAAIRSGIDSGRFDDLPAEAEDLEAMAREGRLLARRYFARERDPKLRKKKIEAFLKVHDRVTCEVCSFDYEATYGPRGAQYTECHHVVPLHASGETTTRLKDLVLICANCHKMIHRYQPWLTPDELRAMLRI